MAYSPGDNQGSDNYNWHGGRISSAPYVLVSFPEHPLADNRGYVQEHILVAEKALGRHLSPINKVHHVNRVKKDNTPGNLVICESQAYHLLLHRRWYALIACGHADWRKCNYCKQYDAPKNMTVREYPRHSSAHHKLCRAKYERERINK